jgi:hypothetical protein
MDCINSSISEKDLPTLHRVSSDETETEQEDALKISPVNQEIYFRRSKSQEVDHQKFNFNKRRKSYPTSPPLEIDPSLLIQLVETDIDSKTFEVSKRSLGLEKKKMEIQNESLCLSSLYKSSPCYHPLSFYYLEQDFESDRLIYNSSFSGSSFNTTRSDPYSYANNRSTSSISQPSVTNLDQSSNSLSTSSFKINPLPENSQTLFPSDLSSSVLQPLATNSGQSSSSNASAGSSKVNSFPIQIKENIVNNSLNNAKGIQLQELGEVKQKKIDEKESKEDLDEDSSEVDLYKNIEKVKSLSFKSPPKKKNIKISLKEIKDEDETQESSPQINNSREALELKRITRSHPNRVVSESAEKNLKK